MPRRALYFNSNGKFDMKKVVLGFVSAAALASVSLAMAGGMTSMAASDQSSVNNASGVFISGNLGYAKQNAKVVSPLTAKDLRGFAWNANAGYQFNQYLALEAGYTRFSDVKAAVGSNKFDAKLYGVDVLAKAIYPINDQFNVFAKAGAMDMFQKTSADGVTTVNRSRIVPEFGVGTSYNVTSNVALTLQGITTLAMKGPKNGSGTMPATYTGLAGVSYKFNI